MKFNCNDDEDSEHAELLLLLAKVAHLAGDEDRRLKNKNKREGTRLNAPTVPRQRRSVTHVCSRVPSSPLVNAILLGGRVLSLYATVTLSLPHHTPSALGT